MQGVCHGVAGGRKRGAYGYGSCDGAGGSLEYRDSGGDFGAGESLVDRVLVAV